MKKKTLSLLLALSMTLGVLSVMPAMANGAYTPASDLSTLQSTFVEEELTEEYFALAHYDNLLFHIIEPSDNATYMLPQEATPAALSDSYPYIKVGISGSDTAAKIFNNKVVGSASDFTAIFSNENGKKVQLNYAQSKNPTYYAFDLAHTDVKAGNTATPKYFNRVSVAGNSGNTAASKTTQIDAWKLNITDDSNYFVGTTTERDGTQTADTLANWKTIYTSGAGENIYDKAGTVKLDSIVQSRYLMVEVDNIAIGGTNSNTTINFRLSGFQAYLEDVVAKADSGYTVNAKEKTVALEENPAAADFLANLELQDANLQAGVFADEHAAQENTGKVADGNYLITYFDNSGSKEIVSVYSITAPEIEPEPEKSGSAFTPDSEEDMPTSTFVTEKLTNTYYALPGYTNLLTGIIEPGTEMAKRSSTASGSGISLTDAFPYIKIGSSVGDEPNLFNTNNASETAGFTTLFSYDSNPENVAVKTAQLNYDASKNPVYYAFDLAHAEEKAVSGSGTPKYFNRVSIAGRSDNATNSTKKTTIDEWKLNIADRAEYFIGTNEENPGDNTAATLANWRTIYQNNKDAGENVSGEAGTVKLDNIVQSRYLMVEVDNVAVDGSGAINFRWTGFQVYLEDVVAKADSGYTVNAKEKTVTLEENPAAADFLVNLELQDANLQAGVFADENAAQENTGKVADGNYLITYFKHDGEREIVSVYTITAPEGEEPTPTPTETPTPTPTETPTPTPTPTETPTPAETSKYAFTPDSAGTPGNAFMQESLTNEYYALGNYNNLLQGIIEPGIEMVKRNASTTGSGVSLTDAAPYLKIGISSGNEANIFNSGSAANFAKSFNYDSDSQKVSATSAQFNFAKTRTPIYFAFDLAHGDEKEAPGSGTPKYFNRVSMAGNMDNATTSTRTTTVDNWKIKITNTAADFVGTTETTPGTTTAALMGRWKTIYQNGAGETISGEAGTVKLDSIVQSRYAMVEVDNIAIGGTDGSSTINFRLTGFQVYLEDVVSNDSDYVVNARTNIIELANGDSAPTVSEFLGKLTLEDANLHVGIFSDTAGTAERASSELVSVGSDYLITYFGEGADKEIVSVYDISGPAPRVENVVVNALSGTDIGSTLNVTYTFQDCSIGGHTDQSVINWYADGVIIEGEHGKTYVLRAEDLGKSISAEVIPSCGLYQGKTVVSAQPSAAVKRIVVGNLMSGATVTEVENLDSAATVSMLQGYAIETGTVNATPNTARFRATLDKRRWITDFNLVMTENTNVTGYKLIGYKDGEAVTISESTSSGGGTVSEHLATAYCLDEIEVQMQSNGDSSQKLGVNRFEIFSNLTDADAVKYDSQNLTIQDADMVLSDLTLPLAGDAYTSIQWTSSDTSIITNDGTIVAAFANPPYNVTMTAVVSRGSESTTVQIPMKVYGVDRFEMPAYSGIGENLVLYSIITAEGELKTGSTANLAADGKGNTGWTAKFDEAALPSLVIDFGTAREVNRLRAAEMLVGIDHPIAGYTVSTSNDKATWTTLFSGTTMGAEVFDKSFDTVECRYVKFTITALQAGAEYGGLRELELYYEPSASDIAQMEAEEVSLDLAYVISTTKIELPQPKYGAAFHWVTEGGLIADDGTVTHLAADTKVTLTLQITYEDETITKSFGQFLITGTENKTISGSGGGGGSRTSSSSSGGGLGILGNAPQVETPSEPVETVAGFDDVSKYHWASGYIGDLAAKGILAGVTQNLFAPEDAITREQMAKLLVCAFDVPAASGAMPFTDVPESDWSAEYVLRAANGGLLKGIEDGVFGLGSNMSRQDVAVAIGRVLEQNGIVLEEGNLEAFTDAASIDEYAKSAVAKLYQAGVMVGDDQNSFRPKDEVTRAEAAKIIYVTMKLASGSGE